MSNEHVLALRAALVRSETDLANAQRELIQKAEELEKAKTLAPRTELRWPWGCKSVRQCIYAKECVSSCPTHSGRPLREAIHDAKCVANMVYGV